MTQRPFVSPPLFAQTNASETKVKPFASTSQQQSKPSIYATTSSEDPTCCGDIVANGDPRLTGIFVIFRWRLTGWNVSMPALVTHLWELLVALTCFLSLMDIGIPASPGLWAPITVLCAAVVYFLLTAIAYFTLPDLSLFEGQPYAAYVRYIFYQQNDAKHFRIGFGIYAFVAAFYFVWYFVVAGSSTPVNPLVNVQTYIAQQQLHTILATSSLFLVLYYLLINVTDIRGLTLTKYK